MLRRKKACLVFVFVLLVNTFSMVHAEKAIVGTRVASGGNESDIYVFGTDASFKYDTTNLVGYDFESLSSGAFMADPVSGQVMVTAYDSVNDRSFARCYAIGQTSATALFDTAKINGYKFTDITSAQFDSDGINEYAITAYQSANDRSAMLRYDGQTLMTQSIWASGVFTGIAASCGDSDVYSEIVASRYVDPAGYQESDIYYFDDDGTHMKNSVNRYPMRYSDVATGDVDGDGLDETFVAVDRSTNTSPATSFAYNYQQYGSCSWTEAAGTGRFGGAARKIAAGNFDSDPEIEFVVARTDWFDYSGATQQEAEIRIYDDDMSLLADSTNPWGLNDEYTCIKAADLDLDGIDEIIVGYLQSDGTSSTLRIFDNSAALLYESSSFNGKFTDLAIVDVVPEPSSVILLLGGILLFTGKRRI